MDSLSTYNLTDFVAFNHEVYQGLYTQLNETLWPIQFVIVACAIGLFILRKRTKGLRDFFLFLSWNLIGWVFHYGIYAEVLWAASYFACGCTLQSLLYLLHSCAKQNSLENLDKPLKMNALGWFIFLICAFLPFSYFLPWSAGEILLLGWGPDQTALGSIGAALLCASMKWRIILSIIPVLWLIVQFLTNYAIYLKF